VPVRRVGRLVLDRVVDNFFAETEQVAFCTQNVVPGVDFTNDPLLQGRNFSYLDTQLKRLGSPNFTHIPVNAPKTAVSNYQQDGHMAMRNPRGRINYEPNSWGGPREDRTRGFVSYAEENGGGKRRLRAESFADHYSQARQFYVSQTEVERRHIAAAFTFELSKCEKVAIRERMVAGLRNVHPDLAQAVADGLGLSELPDALPPAREPRTDLPESPPLSILANGPSDFTGRKLGVLLTDGADAGLLGALREAAQARGVTVELVAPAVGGVTTSDGSAVAADQKLDGAPSVLYDAVAILADAEGASRLADAPAARDFVSDAFAHCKFIAHTDAATTLFEAVGLAEKADAGFVALNGNGSAGAFLDACAALRHWDREASLV
jgi:catalase